MAKVFLTCFPPFKPLSLDELACGIFSPLTIDLQCLKRSLDDNPPSLQWCIEAMLIIKKIHSQLLLYLERSHVPTSWEGVNVVDAYMRVTLDLLDFCNSLKSTISSLDRYRMMVDFMVKSMEDALIPTMTRKIEFTRPKGENSILNKLSDTSKWRMMNLHKESLSKVKLKTSNSMQIIQVIGSAMSIISLLVFCSILHPTPIKIDEGLYSELTNPDSLSSSIKELIASFVERYKFVQNTGRPVLYENEMIEDALSACRLQVVSTGEGDVCQATLPETVKLVKRRSLALKEGLGLFECVVNELFAEVIKGRKQFIDMITSNN